MKQYLLEKCLLTSLNLLAPDRENRPAERVLSLPYKYSENPEPRPLPPNTKPCERDAPRAITESVTSTILFMMLSFDSVEDEII